MQSTSGSDKKLLVQLFTAHRRNGNKLSAQTFKLICQWILFDQHYSAWKYEKATEKKRIDLKDR